MTKINIIEGRYAVRNITDADELKLAYMLRYDIFAEELKWIPQDAAGLDIDHYDEYAVSFGVFSLTGNLLAYIRLIPGEKTFMMEREFGKIVAGRQIRHGRDSAELSRFCVARKARNLRVSVWDLSMFLLKGVYLWCEKNRVTYIYAVTDDKNYNSYLSRGFPFHLIGQYQTASIALMLDWDEFERVNRIERPRLYSWFNSIPD